MPLPDPGSAGTVAEVDERGATCVTNLRAYHRIAGRDQAATWMLAGRYLLSLDRDVDGWRISGITLRVAYEDGDRALADQARERVAAGTGGRTIPNS